MKALMIRNGKIKSKSPSIVSAEMYKKVEEHVALVERDNFAYSPVLFNTAIRTTYTNSVIVNLKSTHVGETIEPLVLVNAKCSVTDNSIMCAKTCLERALEEVTEEIVIGSACYPIGAYYDLEKSAYVIVTHVVLDDSVIPLLKFKEGYELTPFKDLPFSPLRDKLLTITKPVGGADNA